MKAYTHYDFLDCNNNFKFDDFISSLRVEIDKAYSSYYHSMFDVNVCDYTFSDYSLLLSPLHFLEVLQVNIFDCSNMLELDKLFSYSYQFLATNFNFADDNGFVNVDFENFFYFLIQTLSNFDLENATNVLYEYQEVKDSFLLSND